jgi:hypothetical protein
MHSAATRSRCQLPISRSTVPGSDPEYRQHPCFNQMVEAFLQHQPATKYIDIYTAMLGSDRKPNPALFVQDQIHLSELDAGCLRRPQRSLCLRNASKL